MIAVDATPLAVRPRRGVARYLLHLLAAWTAEPPPEGVLLVAPRDLPPDVPRPGELVCPPRALPVRRFRRRVGRLLEARRAGLLYVPWSAFPRVDVPVVATIHEVPFARLGPVEGRVRTWVHRWWLGRNVRACARLVVPSEATRDDVLGLHPEADGRVAVVPPGFDPRPWEAAGRRTPKCERPLVVVVGTGAGAGGWRKKGLDVLDRALAEVGIDDLRVVVVGGVPRRLRRRVEVVRDPEDARLEQLVACAWVLVHPARSEGFGYPPLEAMAAGTAVVAAEGAATGETVADAALRVPPGSASALAGAMRRLLDDGALRARLVEAGRARARAFAPATCARRLLGVLRAAGGSA